MEEIAEFQKVSFEEFCRACMELSSAGALWFAGDEQIREYYNAIQLPRRGTDLSAGYDFYLPFPVSFITVLPVVIPTGVRVILPHNQFLACVPRSGLGFKYGARLVNTVGIIDADYIDSPNEGHIMAKIACTHPFKLNTGDRFMQGIILNYNLVDHDDPIQHNRTGGFGSTGGI